MPAPLHSVYSCPVELALDVLGGKWKTVLLAHLKQGPLRYGELRRRVPTLSDKMLTQRLHELEQLGLIARADEDPARYRLTARGESLRPVLQTLYECGQALADELEITVGQRSNGPRTSG
ncbi:MAG TPA: helix-turn-helix domain-containing protein [Enhygromyxa sp.]|nr:helix-turn-helix domain-containing protein [Enhygromyxa sp.]